MNDRGAAITEFVILFGLLFSLFISIIAILDFQMVKNEVEYVMFKTVRDAVLRSNREGLRRIPIGFIGSHVPGFVKFRLLKNNEKLVRIRFGFSRNGLYATREYSFPR